MKTGPEWSKRKAVFFRDSEGLDGERTGICTWDLYRVKVVRTPPSG